MLGQLANHLLQSTLFALAAALLVLAFRKNRARVRYSLWLAASLKFLIPFSVLIALGSQVRWTPAAHEIVTRAALPDVVQTVEQFSQPFTVAIPAATQQTDRRPFAIAALWFCGFAFIMVLRLRAWRGMRIAIRRSQPLDPGLTVRQKNRYVDEFVRFCSFHSGHSDLKDINTMDFLSYRKWLESSCRTYATGQAKIGRAIQWFNWLAETGRIKQNPARGLIAGRLIPSPRHGREENATFG